MDRAGWVRRGSVCPAGLARRLALLETGRLGDTTTARRSTRCCPSAGGVEGGTLLGRIPRIRCPGPAFAVPLPARRLPRPGEEAQPLPEPAHRLPCTSGSGAWAPCPDCTFSLGPSGRRVARVPPSSAQAFRRSHPSRRAPSDRSPGRSDAISTAGSAASRPHIRSPRLGVSSPTTSPAAPTSAVDACRFCSDSPENPPHLPLQCTALRTSSDLFHKFFGQTPRGARDTAGMKLTTLQWN